MPITCALVLPSRDPTKKYRLAARHKPAYQELLQIGKSLNLDFHFVRDNETFLGNGTWEASFSLDEKGKYFDTPEIQTDLILVRGSAFTQFDNKTPTLNPQPLIQLCKDKFLTFQTFPDLSPFSIQVENFEQLQTTLPQISGKLKVAKPLQGSCGKGIIIGSDDLILKSEHDFPLILQEFFDTSAGLPPIFTGIHDIRLGILKNEIVFAYARLALPDSFLANVTLGAKIIELKLSQLPQSVHDLVTKITQHTSKFGPNYFSIDLAFVGNEPKLIELNSSPSLVPNSQGPNYSIFKTKLCQALLDLLPKKT